MPRQQIIWTALPNGPSQPPSLALLKLSVFVAPRLQLDGEATLGTLAVFPDFLDWPERLRSGRVSFKVVVDDDVGGAIPTRIITEPALDSELWRALFGAETPVRSHRFEAAREPVTTYPAKGTEAAIDEGYTSLGSNSHYCPPSREAVKQAFPSLAAAMQRSAGLSPATLVRGRGPAEGRGTLERLHLEIGAALLRNDRDVSFAEKLEAAMSVAGELARSAAPDEAVPIVPPTADKASPFIQFAAFHERLPVRRRDSVLPAAAPEADIIDFHQSLSALGEFSLLLRRLGLVIDLEFPATDALRSVIGGLKHLRVEVTLDPARPNENYTPVTTYLLDDRTVGSPLPFPLFVAAPRAAAQLSPDLIHEPGFEIVGGLLNLGITQPDVAGERQQFDIVQIDVDGAAKKLLNVIREISDEEDRPDRPIDAPATSAAPSFRASGLSLVRSGQATALKADQARAAEHEAAMQVGQQAVLFAEDLVRGYRIDVRTIPRGAQAGEILPWQSLHRRITSFCVERVGAGALTLPDHQDEGFVQPSFVQDLAAAGAGNPLYVNESFCHWQGWSLSAPPPANPLDFGSESPPPATTSALPRVDVTTQAAPASLPRLRYGNSYQLRARTVDLAGNSLSVEAANRVLSDLRLHGRPEPVIPVIEQDLPYRRYDCVPAPVLVPREELTEGEALDTLVVRSNGPGTTTASYAAAALGGGRYKGVSERHIAPPKTSQGAAETHGMLDGAIGAGGDPARVFNLCQRAGGTFNDAFVTDLATGAPEPLSDIVEPVTGIRIPHGIRFLRIEQPAASADAVAPEDAGYTIHYERQLRLPYLPDPLARGAALFDLPGSEGKSLILTPGLTPDAPAELKVVTPQLLPQQAIEALGFITKIDFGPPDSWPELSPFVLQLDGASDEAPRAPTWSEAAGARTLTVRLAPGETRTIKLSCYPDASDVALLGLHFWWARVGSPEGDRTFLNMAQHGALSMLTPTRRLTLVHAVQQPVLAPLPDGVPFGLEKPPRETFVWFRGHFRIHGLSTAKLDLFASWTELDETNGDPVTYRTHVFEFPIHRDVGPAPPPGDPVPIAKYVQEIDRVELYGPSDNPLDIRKRLARQEFNDTKHRVVDYRLVATTRFREFFPERITADIGNITRETPFTGMIVPNSAFPPVPEISHIVPSFGWEVNAGLTRSKRIGAGLRVYLGRTWFATGEGEQLAVVGDPESGDDPIHVSPDTSFRAVLPTVRSVSVPGSTTWIYPFPVHFERESGLWYADLSFDSGERYFPFVKLVLARYQPQSLEGMHLSQPVAAGIHQLAPDRMAELEYFDVAGHPGKRRIAIKITGAKASAARLAGAQRDVSYGIEVNLEERPKLLGVDERDDHLGWRPADPAMQPVAGSGSAAPILWQGELLVPQAASSEQRIVIREYEIFPRNELAPGQGWIGQSAEEASRRLVYADVIPVL